VELDQMPRIDPLNGHEVRDLVAVEGRDLVVQAVWLRLATPLGELAHLGHARFGSRIHLLIGRLLGPETLALAEAYTREALRREPLVQEIVRVLALARGDTIAIEVVLRPEVYIHFSFDTISGEAS